MKFQTLASHGFVLACLVASQAPAQSPAPQPALSPDDLQRRAAAVSATLTPLVSKTSEETAEAQFRIAERPETAERIAAFKKNLYEALRKKGFTAEQALELTVATSMPPFSGR